MAHLVPQFKFSTPCLKLTVYIYDCVHIQHDCVFQVYVSVNMLMMDHMSQEVVLYSGKFLRGPNYCGFHDPRPK